MELLRNLDIVGILKIGAIGLGFLLALLSFLLLRKEQDKKEPSKSIITSIRFFMFFAIAMMILGIVAEFFKSEGKLSMQLGGNVLTVDEFNTREVSSLNAGDHFINSQIGFAFKQPGKDWSDIRIEEGVSGSFKLMGIKSDILTEQQMTDALKQNPLGPLFFSSKHFYFDSPASRTSIAITDSSATKEVNAYLKILSDELLNENSEYFLDTSNVEANEYYLNTISSYRKQLIGFDTLDVKEAFLLSAYPKNVLPDYLKGMKLPAFFTSLSLLFGSNTDKLLANEKQILAGTELYLENVVKDGSVVDFANKKWMLFTENENYFFTIEISYPSAFSKSVSHWDELQAILNSFVVLK